MQVIFAVNDLGRSLDFYDAPAYLYVRVDDAEATAARVVSAGGRPLSPLAARSWGETAAWFADPHGNVVAVAESTDEPG